jgi:hypothetical protein
LELKAIHAPHLTPHPCTKQERGEILCLNKKNNSNDGDHDHDHETNNKDGDNTLKTTMMMTTTMKQ